MKSLYFPSIDEADESGLLAEGGLFEVELLLDAYQNGIFPWPYGEGEPILWFAPPLRGILFFDELHLPRRFQSRYKNHGYKITFNQDFEQVITHCAHIKRKDAQGTWITAAMIRGYKRLFEQGYIQSCEVWEDENLIAGLYGVFVGYVFSAESMFTTKTDASKIALTEMIYHLQKQGLTWMDTQMTTPIVKSFGGREIPRKDYMELLRKSQNKHLT